MRKTSTPINDAHQRAVSAELIRLTGREEVVAATTAVCDVFEQSLGLDPTARRVIDNVLSEITENVFHHAHSPTGAYLCCQGYQDRLTATIVDLGDGIGRRLTDTPALKQKIEFHGGPLQAAIAAGVTSRPAHNSGYGLAITSQMILQNHGTLQIHSQRDRLIQHGESIREETVESRWPGTVINIVVDRSRPLDMKAIYEAAWPTETNDGIDFLDG